MKDLDKDQLIAALTFYADRANYYAQPGQGNPIRMDEGNLAKTVLAGLPVYKPEDAK